MTDIIKREKLTGTGHRLFSRQVTSNKIKGRFDSASNNSLNDRPFKNPFLKLVLVDSQSNLSFFVPPRKLWRAQGKTVEWKMKMMIFCFGSFVRKTNSEPDMCPPLSIAPFQCVCMRSHRGTHSTNLTKNNCYQKVHPIHGTCPERMEVC